MKTETLSRSLVRSKRATGEAAPILGPRKGVRPLIERARSEAELKGLLKEVIDLKAALDEHAIVAITDAQGKITYVNDKFCAISKYTREELLGQDHRIINSGFHPTEFIRDLWTTIAHGRVWHGEIKNRAKDGSFYWVDTTIVPFLNENGKPRQYVAIRADITERKLIEEQLRGSLREVEDLKAALDEHAIVAMTDPQGRITYVNDKFCAISKYSREELLGQDHRIINSGYHPTEFIRNLWTTITHGKVWHGEIKNKAKDGSFYWVDTTIVPFLKEDGKPRQYVAIRADITERKEIEEQLRRSLREVGDLKTALDEHAIVAMTDPQGRITYVNDKFCAISKYSREELLGQDHRIINSGFHPEEFIRDLWTTITSGHVWHGEIKNRAKDGTFYWVDTTIVPFLNEKGKPRQYVAIRADITERKAAEEGVAELAAIVESSDDAIIGKDLEGVVTSWNAGAEKMFGYAPSEMIGLPSTRLIPPARQEEEANILGQVKRGESVRHFETVRVRKDGTTLDVSVAVSAIKDRSGKIVGASKVVRDMTEKGRTEQALNASEMRYRRLFETAKDGILILDAETGMVVDVNPFLITTLGFSHEQFLSKAIWELGFFNDIWANEEKFAELKGKEYVRYEHLPLETRSGARIEVEFVSNVYLVNGRRVIQCNVRDVTARRQAEEALRQLNASLEQRVIERTTQLEAANNDLESFSYSVSHDLRAPLRAISGFSKIVREDHSAALDADGLRYLGLVEKSAVQMGQLIDDLLTFSRTGRQALTLKTVNTAELVNACLADLEGTKGNRHVTVNVGVLPDCEADASLLRQVWLNLLENALKYTKKRDPAVITIGSERAGGTNSYFVQDNGAGFDMKYADKLFGVFQRLHLADDYEGTGVGLALVQRIVQRHGGRVWTEAKLDLGATFHFTLTGGQHA